MSNSNIYARYALLDALHHEAPATELKSTKRLLLRSLYHSVLFKAIFVVATCVMLIVLPFIEHKSSFTASTNYLMLEEESAPTKNKLLMTSLIIELFFLGVLMIDVILRGVVLFPRPYKKFCASYVFTYCAYTAALVISWICLIGSFITLAESVPSLDALTFIRQLVRPMFLIVQVSMMRKGLKAIFYSSLQLISILLLLFIVVFVFMMLGFAIFPRHLHSEHFGQSNIVADTDTVEEGETYFNSSTDTFWYLLVYLSTANSPDFGTPAYSNHRAYFMYFGIFFFVTNYLILKVISAFYALRFLYFLKESMKRTNEHRKECFKEAFEALRNGSFVRVQTIRNITVSDLNLIDEDSFQLLCVSMSVRLNIHNENELKINKDKFNSLLSKIFSCHMPLQEDKNFYAFGISDINKKCITTYLCVKFVTDLLSLPFAVIQFMCLTIFFMNDYDNSLTDPHSTMVKAMLAFSCLLFPEFFTRFFLLIGHFIWPSNSFKDFDVKKSCMIVLKWFFLGHKLRSDAATKRFLGFLVDFFDWLLLLWIIILGFFHVPCLNKGTYDDCFGLRNLIRIIQVTIVLVIFRMFRMLAKIPTFAIVFKSLIHILILFVPLMLLGYLFYYEFAVIGMAIFRGVNLNDTMAARDCGSYENLNYHPYNFEDFGSSLVVLWNLMIVNNWHIIVDAYVRRMSPYVRIYFVIWWLFTETILNGVLFGFLLEILSQATKNYFDSMQKVTDSKSFFRKFCLILEQCKWWGENHEVNTDLSFEMSWNIYDVIEHKEEMKESPL